MQYGMLQASTESYIQTAIKEKNELFLTEQLKAWKEYRPHVDLWAIVDARAVTIASLNSRAAGARISINGLVESAIDRKEPIVSTEVVPMEVLAREGLVDRARVEVAGGTGEVGDRGGRERAGELTDGMLMVVVTPVMDQAGEVTGAIITGDLTNNDTFVPDTFAGVFPGSMVSITIGDVQISTNLKTFAGEKAVGHVLPAYVYEEIKTKKDYRGLTSLAGRDYISAFEPIVNHRGEVIGSLFVGVPKDRFDSLQNENIKAIISISLIALFLASGMASFITFMITRPIKALKDKARLISAGDLNIRTGFPTGGKDEIADLAKTFKEMVGSLRDKEERIRVSQDKLSQQKNLIESIINSLPYCLYVLERNMSIAAWNRHASKPCPICRCAPGVDSYNENFIEHLYDDELKGGLKEVIESVFRTRNPRNLEQKLTRKGPGEKDIFVRTSIFPILSEGGGSADYVVWMAEDITETKEMEATVISSEKLAAVGQLAAGVAHEVNNPLGGILNCLYNFKNKKLTDERKTEYLGFMEDGITRVQNIVRQLLDFSQQHAPELVLTDINRMVDGMVPLFHHSIKGKEIKLVTKLGEGLPEILADKHQIEQILVNLILNAIQSVNGEGRIEISTDFEGGWFRITVADNGCGIPPEHLTRIFDPFFTTKGVGKGTGLGLSVSRGIIERHKGRIEVESEVEGGTVFKVYLPIPAEPA
jgi:signal transduction histidine kinase/HAMP domain-containing protein